MAKDFEDCALLSSEQIFEAVMYELGLREEYNEADAEYCDRVFVVFICEFFNAVRASLLTSTNVGTIRLYSSKAPTHFKKSRNYTYVDGKAVVNRVTVRLLKKVFTGEEGVDPTKVERELRKALCDSLFGEDWRDAYDDGLVVGADIEFEELVEDVQKARVAVRVD